MRYYIEIPFGRYVEDEPVRQVSDDLLRMKGTTFLRISGRMFARITEHFRRQGWPHMLYGVTDADDGTDEVMATVLSPPRGDLPGIPMWVRKGGAASR